MSDRNPQTSPPSIRIARAKHDLRNPLGEIIGFAEILEEEASEPGQVPIRSAFAAMRSEARTLLDRLEATLSDHRLRDDPAAVAGLIADFRETTAKIREKVGETTRACTAMPGRPFLDDLARVDAAAAKLAGLAPSLLTGLQDGESSGHGEATVESRSDGGGAEEPADRAAVQVGRGLASTAVPAGALILVVDDNEPNRALLARRLVRGGHTIAHAADGEEALARLLTQAFDLVLLDVLMPKMTGHQVLSVMKADPALRHIPVIMITGLDDVDSLIGCIQGGAEDYLTKPFDPVLLNARIGASLERKRLRDSEQDLLRQVRLAQEQSESLLLNILPRTIANRLKAGESTIVDTFPEVTVLFADLAGFTQLSACISGADLVRLLDELFTTFDLLAQRQGLEKIKTIGDAYMVVGGLPVPRADHARAVAELALDMVAAVRKQFSGGPHPVSIRIGISSGPVVAGVIGRHKFSYDLWGDTVNTASRMESYGEPDAIQVSADTHRILAADYEFIRRDLTQVKGKGDLTAWILTGRRG